MPPQRDGGIRKRKTGSSESSRARSGASPSTTTDSEIVASQFPMPPTYISTKTGETPLNSPLINSAMKQRMVLTQAQKQALIDNLQLEITERARKLRAQYALQAQGLRMRLELRVHRIPLGLRKVKISDLLVKHEQGISGTQQHMTSTNMGLASHMNHLRQSPGKVTEVPGSKLGGMSPSRGIKRSSNHLDNFLDKENFAPASSPPKKRTRTSINEKNTAAAATTASTIVSAAGAQRQVAPSQVLSPKSNNSRTMLRSPPKSPMKPTMISSRPASPIKPSAIISTGSSLANTAEKAAASGTSSKPLGRVNSTARGAAPTTARAASRTGATAGKANTTITTTTTAAAAAAAAPRTRKAAAPTISVVVDDSSEEDKSQNNRNSGASEMTNASAGTTIVKKKTTTVSVSKRGTAPTRATVTRSAKSTTKTATAGTAATAAKEKKAAAGIMGALGGIGARGRKAVTAAAGQGKAAKTAKATTRTTSSATASKKAAASAFTGRSLRTRS